MAGTIVVDRIESDSSYTSTVNVASKVNFTGGMQIGGQDTTFGSMRNRIINGDMRIDQRNSGALITSPASAQYLVDRFWYRSTQTAKANVQQNYNSVTPPAGFINYLGVVSTSAYAVLSGDRFNIAQNIEGLNVADLGWGAAGAATITLSFQVYSSLTGTFGGALQNSAGDRSYPFTYTISSANTWTSIRITIAGDTSGTWLNTNGTGIAVYWGLGAGSTTSGTAGAWASAGYFSATGAVSVVGTNGATFYITGVQLEKGSSATAFEYRQYGTEFALCQRYFVTLVGGSYFSGFGFSTNRALGSIPYPVYMRAAPTATFSSGTHYFFTQNAANIISSIGSSPVISGSIILDCTVAVAAGAPGVFSFASPILLSSEL
jgi:hypothetical protein